MRMECERQVNSGKNALIKCENVGKTFRSAAKGLVKENEIIHNLDMSVYENEFVVVFGPAQCGKTTLLKMIAGLESISQGAVYIGGKQVDSPQTELGMVYQSVALFPWLTVMENVEFGLKMRNIPKKKRQERAQYFIDLVGLQGFENSFPVKLSGGMKQRVGIARAYCTDPEVILLDEPFGALDAQTRYMMEEEIERICSQERRTVVFVTNNVEEAVYLADRIIMMSPSPSVLVDEFIIDLPRPRNLISDEFLRWRKTITERLEEISRLHDDREPDQSCREEENNVL